MILSFLTTNYTNSLLITDAYVIHLIREIRCEIEN